MPGLGYPALKPCAPAGLIFIPPPARLPKETKRGIFWLLEKNMGTKVKPVQPTEIKDKKIAREVIEQIRKPIPASVHKRHEKLKAYIKQFEQ
jgi:hypothetical protein